MDVTEIGISSCSRAHTTARSDSISGGAGTTGTVTCLRESTTKCIIHPEISLTSQEISACGCSHYLFRCQGADKRYDGTE